MTPRDPSAHAVQENVPSHPLRDDPPVGPPWLSRAAAVVDTGLERFASGALVATGSVVLLLAVWICASGVPTVRGVDLNVVFTMQKALQGQPLYTDPALPPFDVAQYSPLYYLLCTGLARLLGVTFTEPAALLLLGRTVSTICALLTAALVVYIARAILNVRPMLAYGAAVFSFVAVSPWLFLARPDSLTTLLTVTAFTLALQAATRTHRSALYATGAALAAVAAVFAKQSGLPAGAIVVLFFALAGRWRLCFVACGVGAAAGAVTGALALQHWPLLLENIVRGVDNGISLTNAFEKTYTSFVYPFGLLLGLSVLILVHWTARTLTTKKAFFFVALPVLLVFATVTGLKAQSAENYYNEWIIVAALALALFLEEPASASQSRSDVASLRRVLAGVLLCWLPFWTISHLRYYWWERLDRNVSWIVPINSLWLSEYDRLAELVEQELAGSPARHVLAFSLPANNGLPTRALVPQKEVAMVMFARGLVDYRAFQDIVRAGEVGVIVTPSNWATTPTDFLGVPMPETVGLDVVGGFRIWRAVPPPPIPHSSVQSGSTRAPSTLNH